MVIVCSKPITTYAAAVAVVVITVVVGIVKDVETALPLEVMGVLVFMN